VPITAKQGPSWNVWIAPNKRWCWSATGSFAQLLAQWTPPPHDSSVAACCVVVGVYESVRHWLELPPDQLPAVQAFAGVVSAFNVRAIATSLSEDSPRHQNKNENHKERTADSSVSAI
jgi:hypothetical protein